MGRVSFEEAVKEETPTQEIVVKAETTLAVPSIADPEKGLVGEWTSEDLRLPRLSLVNKSGDLSNSFTPGCWVLQKEHQISDLAKDNKERGNTITVIGARMAKQYQENIPYDLRDSVPTRVFNTAAEVRAVNGVVSRRKGESNFSEIAHIEFFVQENDTVSEDAKALFYYTFGDKKYARVIYTASSTAFSAVAVTMASALKGHLAIPGLVGGFWHLGSALEKNPKNSWWIPTLRSAGLVAADVQEEIKAIL